MTAQKDSTILLLNVVAAGFSGGGCFDVRAGTAAGGSESVDFRSIATTFEGR
jgi:hypothetical protein